MDHHSTQTYSIFASCHLTLIHQSRLPHDKPQINSLLFMSALTNGTLFGILRLSMTVLWKFNNLHFGLWKKKSAASCGWETNPRDFKQKRVFSLRILWPFVTGDKFIVSSRLLSAVGIYFLRVSCLETGSAEGQRLKGYICKGYTLNFSLFVAEIVALWLLYCCSVKTSSHSGLSVDRL